VTTTQRRGVGEGLKVLLVDPDDAMLAHTAQGLRAEGFKVVALARREAAGPLLDAFQPDALVVAVRAAREVPAAAARHLSTLAQGAVPITYLVPPGDERLHTVCLEEGQGVEVVHLPCDTAQLAERLRTQLRLRETLLARCRTPLEGPGAVLCDPLTGTSSRTYLQALVAEEIRRAERYGGAFSVVAASLKGHGEVKKSLGPALAERLVVYASVVLAQTVRESDVVARIGEAQFALLLPNTAAGAAEAFIGRLEARLTMARLELNGRVFSAQMDFGAASFPGLTRSAGEIVGAAFHNLRQPRPYPAQDRAASLSA
jgi:two-component system cell cycle response regulator